MKLMWMLFSVAIVAAVNCQPVLRFEHDNGVLPNNSYITYTQISTGDRALKCVTDSADCCTDPDVGNWTYERGRAVQQGADENTNGDTCPYVTRGQGEVSLNRNSTCYPDFGLWRCDIPDSSGVIQSMYIYIGSSGTSDTQKGELPLYGMIMMTMTCYFTGRLRSSSMSFTLHTEPRESPPEFSLTCRSEGGPATTVSWQRNGHSVQEDSDHQTSQVIVDTSHNSLYDNKLRVRGREGGDYSCTVSNNIRDYHSHIAEENAMTGTQLNIQGVFLYKIFIIL